MRVDSLSSASVNLNENISNANKYPLLYIVGEFPKLHYQNFHSYIHQYPPPPPKQCVMKSNAHAIKMYEAMRQLLIVAKSIGNGWFKNHAPVARKVPQN